MASSGNIYSTAYNGLKRLRFYWYIESQSVANNQTTILWALYGDHTSGAGGYHTSGNFKVTFDGVTVFSSATRIDLYHGTVVTGWNRHTFGHDNLGNRSVPVYIEAGIYYVAVNVSGSGTMTFDQIPRYANINSFTLDNRQIRRFRANFTTDKTVDTVQYSLNGGGWTGALTGDRTSGNFELTGLSPNTAYTLRIRVKAKDSQLWTESSTQSITTFNIGTVTGADNFNDEANPNITYSNPFGNSVTTLKAGIFATNGSTQFAGYRDISKTGTSYQFILTTTERDALRNATPNSNTMTVRFYIQTVTDSTTYTHYLERTLTIINGNPTFSSFTYKDTNSNTVAVTGNDQILLKNQSQLRATVPVANRMTPRKGSTASKYTATIDNRTKDGTFSSSADVNMDLTTVVNAGNFTLGVRAFDSRNNSTLVNKTVTVVDHWTPVLNATVSRLNGFEDQTTLQVKGTYARVEISGADKNTINLLQYRYRETGGVWGTYTNIPYTAIAGVITTTNIILSLDNSKSYEIEIIADDKLVRRTVNGITVSVGLPSLFIGSNKKTIGVGCVPPINAPDGSIWSSGYSINAGIYKTEIDYYYIRISNMMDLIQQQILNQISPSDVCIYVKYAYRYLMEALNLGKTMLGVCKAVMSHNTMFESIVNANISNLESTALPNVYADAMSGVKPTSATILRIQRALLMSCSIGVSDVNPNGGIYSALLNWWADNNIIKNDMVNIPKQAITLNSGWTMHTNSGAMKRNGIIFIALVNLVNSASMVAWTRYTCATLPSHFISRTTLNNFTMLTKETSAEIRGEIEINSIGNIIITPYVAIAGGLSFRATFTYPE